jgi:lysophospholipid acyltransferase (LPLAT)-like uncharacterized protein
MRFYQPKQNAIPLRDGLKIRFKIMIKNKFITLLIHLFVRFLHLTYRYQFIGKENLQKAKENSPFKTYVLSTWHQNLLTTLTTHIGSKYALIVSASKDGDIMTSACESFGHNVARGSSSRGGKEALIEIIKIMKKGMPAAMAVDGPRGPAFKVKPGAIEMARLTQSSVIPVSYYAKRVWCFHKSWDKFKLAKPFTKIVIVYGEPIFISPEVSKEEFEKYQLFIEEQMIQNETIAKNIAIGS